MNHNTEPIIWLQYDSFDMAPTVEVGHSITDRYIWKPVIRSTAHSSLLLLPWFILKAVLFQTCFYIANVKCTVITMHHDRDELSCS